MRRQKTDQELLQEVDGIGPKRSENLISRFGDGREVAQAATSAFGRVAETDGISMDTASDMFDRMSEAGVKDELRNRQRMGGEIRGPVRQTDIGREADGEFARPDSAPDVRNAPIARQDNTGEFGIDPFDITPGYEGAPPVERESREIEFGGEQVDLTQRDTEDLERMNDFFTRNIDAEVEAERTRGGFGTSDFAQEMSERQVDVASELDRRRGSSHHEEGSNHGRY